MNLVSDMYIRFNYGKTEAAICYDYELKDLCFIANNIIKNICKGGWISPINGASMLDERTGSYYFLNNEIQVMRHEPDHLTQLFSDNQKDLIYAWKSLKLKIINHIIGEITSKEFLLANDYKGVRRDKAALLIKLKKLKHEVIKLDAYLLHQRIKLF